MIPDRLWGVERVTADLNVMCEDLRLESGAGKIFVRRWTPAAMAADAVPIVLFHDSLGCVELWRDFPQRLSHACGRVVIAYDRLGFGQSDPYSGDWSADFIRDEAVRFFPILQRGCRFTDFIAFGHSVGGAMAAVCASIYRQSCRGLMTVAAQAFVEDKVLAGIRAAQQDFAKPGHLDRLRKYHGDKTEWVLSAWVDTWHSAEFAPWTIEATADQIRCPLWAVHGEMDEFGSLLHPQRYAKLTAGDGQEHILHNCHHVPHREVPEQLTQLVQSFIAYIQSR